jgi:hypothetical protein
MLIQLLNSIMVSGEVMIDLDKLINLFHGWSHIGPTLQIITVDSINKLNTFLMYYTSIDSYSTHGLVPLHVPTRY